MTILEMMKDPIQTAVTSVTSATLGSIPTLFIPLGFNLVVTRPDVLFGFQIAAWSVAIISGLCTIINFHKRWKKEKQEQK